MRIWHRWRAARRDNLARRALYRDHAARWGRYEALQRRLRMAGHHPSLAGPPPEVPDPRPVGRR